MSYLDIKLSKGCNNHTRCTYSSCYGASLNSMSFNASIAINGASCVSVRLKVGPTIQGQLHESYPPLNSIQGHYY